jgi:hypothetical protein
MIAIAHRSRDGSNPKVSRDKISSPTNEEPNRTSVRKAAVPACVNRNQISLGVCRFARHDTYKVAGVFWYSALQVYEIVMSPSSRWKTWACSGMSAAVASSSTH